MSTDISDAARNLAEVLLSGKVEVDSYSSSPPWDYTDVRLLGVFNPLSYKGWSDTKEEAEAIKAAVDCRTRKPEFQAHRYNCLGSTHGTSHPPIYYYRCSACGKGIDSLSADVPNSVEPCPVKPV